MRKTDEMLKRNNTIERQVFNLRQITPAWILLLKGSEKAQLMLVFKHWSRQKKKSYSFTDSYPF